MKRAWTKKIKAHPACAKGNDVLEGHLNPVQPKVKRRVRTSAAMIGLVISMGAPNILLTRPSDRAPAAEAVGNEPTVSTVPSAGEAELGESIIAVAPEATNLVLAAASSSAVVPVDPVVQPKAAVSTPALPVVEDRVQNEQTSRQLSQKNQVEGARGATQTVGIAPSNSLPKHPDIQTGKVLKSRRVNDLIQKLKASKTVETRSPSYRVNRTYFTATAATAASGQSQVDKSRRVTGEVNATISPKQRILINRLKQKPNRLKNSLAELRSEESNNQKAPTRKSAEHFSASEKVQSTNEASLAPPVARTTVRQQQVADRLVERLKATPQAAVVVPTVPSQTSNQASVAPPATASVEQQAATRSNPVVTSNSSPMFDLQRLKATPPAAVVVPTVPSQTSNQASVAPPATASVEQQAATRSNPVVTLDESGILDAQKLQQTLPQAAVVVPTVPSQTSNQASVAPPATASVEQQAATRSNPVVTLDESGILDAQKLQQTLPQAAVVVPTVPSQTSNQASVAPPATASVEQQAATRSNPVVTLDESGILDAQKLQQTPPEAAVVVPTVPNVNEPTTAIAPVAPDYEVRRGDTLTSLARRYGVSLSELVNANQISDPNLIKINQRIVIPSFPYSSAVGQGATVGQQLDRERLSQVPTNSFESAALDGQQLQQTPEGAVVVPYVANSVVTKPNNAIAPVAPDYEVRRGDTLTSLARRYGVSLSELVNANQISDPDLIKINQRIVIPSFQYGSAVAQTSAAIARRDYSKTTASTVAVPTSPAPYAVTPYLGAAYTGMGGSISDETGRESPPTVEETQLAQSTAAYTGMGGSISDEIDDESLPTAAKLKRQSNPYVQDLRTDIQRLRQKYYAQQTSSQVVPVVSESATDQPINPEFRATQATETLQPTVRKQRPTKDSSRVTATTRARVATVPIAVDASESLKTLRGRQVSPALPPLGGVDTYLPNPSSTPFKGYIWPAKGVLTSGYGWRWGRMHKGIDVAAPIGTPIVAAAPGVVVRAGWNSGGYGKLVDIRHADGAVTRYAHNNRILVQAGQLVEQGQQISEMGSTGFSTGPHLHFEVHPAGKAAVNPIALLPRNRR